MQATQRPIGIDAEKYVAFVVIENFTALVRMLSQITAQPLHRHLLLRNFPVVDQQTTDAFVRPAVLPGIADIELLAIGQAQNAGTLNVQKEKFDRIFDPGNFIAATAQSPKLVDLIAIEVRRELLVL